MQDLQQDDLLTEAAGMAPVSAWRKAAAAAGGSPRQHRRSVSGEGSSSPRSHDSSPGSLRQRVQLLWQMGRRALRATAVAVHLLQQQQQQGGGGAVRAGALPQQYVPGAGAAAHRREVLLHHLGVMLQDQASCLSPWFEPWRFRPQRTPLQLLTLQAAQVRGPPVRP